MKEFMTEILPWLIIVGAAAALALVSTLEKEKGDAKQRHRFINGLCVTLSTGAFVYIVLNWEPWICVGCGILLGMGGFHFGGRPAASGKDSGKHADMIKEGYI